MSLESCPAEVRSGLETLLAELKDISAVRSLLIYGSLARHQFRPDDSDVNLLVVLERSDRELLNKLHGPLRKGWRAYGLAPLILVEDEIPELADVFPIKLLDIKRHHFLLRGEDPLAELKVEDTHLRLRLEQQLRNHLLRLRRRAIDVGSDAGQLELTVRRSLTSLRLELGSLLRLLGQSEPDDIDELFAVACKALGLDEDVLLDLDADDDDAEERFYAMHEVLTAAVRFVDGMETA